MLDLNKLRIFSIVVEAGSFSTAARRLYISQSAVSQHIKELEASLGKQLFQRGSRGVQLTLAGETLHNYTQKILALVTEVEYALTDVDHVHNGKISLGATPGVAVYLAPDWVQQFRARYPHLTVTLQTGITSQVVADVLAQRLDLGIIEGELEPVQHKRLASTEIEEVEQLVVVGRNHPWWQVDQVRLHDLHQQSFIVRQAESQSRHWLETTLRQHHVEPIIGAEFDNLESIKRAVSAGICLSILPGYVVQGDVLQGTLHTVNVEGAPLRRTLKVIWEKQAGLSPIVLAFLQNLALRYPDLESRVAQQG
jgi:LysR family transcriptional regulator, low CO2-responsive transcriptional regulator